MLRAFLIAALALVAMAFPLARSVVEGSACVVALLAWSLIKYPGGS